MLNVQDLGTDRIERIRAELAKHPESSDQLEPQVVEISARKEKLERIAAYIEAMQAQIKTLHGDDLMKAKELLTSVNSLYESFITWSQFYDKELPLYYLRNRNLSEYEGMLVDPKKTLDKCIEATDTLLASEGTENDITNFDAVAKKVGIISDRAMWCAVLALVLVGAAMLVTGGALLPVAVGVGVGLICLGAGIFGTSLVCGFGAKTQVDMDCSYSLTRRMSSLHGTFFNHSKEAPDQAQSSVNLGAPLLATGLQ